MNSRATTLTRLSVIPVFIALIFNVVLAAPIATSPASHALALAGTSFDATDGNLTVEAPEIDWCTPAPNLVVGYDSPSGSSDTSFVSSPNKEDTDGPTLGNGTIPNNKDDLLREYIASQTVNGDLFVYLAWVRADSTGTSTIDFEFNQSSQLSVNGVTKQRTDGDLLVTFDFQSNPGSGGGYNVDLVVRTWSSAAVDQPDPTSTPPNRGAWINPVDVDASGLAEGSVNFFGTSREPIAISDCVNGGTLDNGEFGEAALNLTDIIGGACRAFGSVFTKSRSSNSFSADLKDRIDPVAVNFSTCGQLTILKQDENQQPLGGATFSVTPNPFTLTGSLSVTDNTAPDDNAAAGTIHLSDVEPGTYTVCETAAPAGYIIDTACQQLTIAANGAATFGPFTNGLGDISWTKLDDQSGTPVCCATFTLVGTAGAAAGFSRTVTDNGTNDEDPDAGKLLVTGLLLGTYRVTETVPPAGYDLPGSAFQDVVLAGETASPANAFRDPPQADASITKQAVVDPIAAGADAAFTIVVSAGGTGDSEDVVLSDLNATGHAWTVTGTDAGDCDDTSVADGETLRCDFGTVANGESRTVTITMTSDVDDCANGIANTASVTSSNDHDASNDEASDSIVVECPGLNIVKTADADPINGGDEASFTITVWNAGPGNAFDVTLHDTLPSGPLWDLEILQGDPECSIASSLSLDDVEQRSIDCDLGTLAPSSMADGVIVRVFAQTDRTHCGLLENTAFADASNNDEVSSSDEITVHCPTLVIDKVADTEVITIGGDGDDLVATPSVVTWTLTYTLTDGPVTNAVISDELPAGLAFLDASDGGTFADGSVTWTFATLSESGSVSFRTTVDPTTISRVGPTVNVAVIDSDQTDPDEGEDDVRVVVDPPPLAGTPTPKPSLPDTAVGIGIGGEPVTVPVELLAALFLGSLGAMALANVRARSRRR